MATILADAPVAFVFMIDDLHAVHSDQGLDVLDVVFSGLPPGSQMVMASREQNRWRWANDHFRIDIDALRIGPNDVQAMFAGKNFSITPVVAAALVSRTEGWPMGLALTAMATRDGEELDAVVDVSGPLNRYLEIEFLTTLPAATQAFLRRTSVLDELTGPLCDEVLTTTDATEHLDRLSRSNVLITPTGETPGVFRYHDLFREFLLGELRRVEPDLVDGLHRRAAGWYETNGSPPAALEHRLKVDHDHEAVRLLGSLARTTYAGGRHATLERWFDTVGEAVIEENPPLAVLASWNSALQGDAGSADRWFALAESATFDGPVFDGSASFESGRAIMRAMRFEHGASEAANAASFAVASEAESSQWCDIAHWVLGEAQTLQGSIAAARKSLARASTLGTRHGRHGIVVASEAALAALAIASDRWNEAELHARSAVDAIERYGLWDYAPSADAFAVFARIATHQRKTSEATTFLNRAMRTRTLVTYAFPSIALRTRLHLVRIYESRGDVAASRQLMDEVDEVLSYRPLTGTAAAEARRLRTEYSTARLSSRDLAPLTPAELRVLPLLQTHLTVDGIAQRLYVSRNTADTHIKSIYQKLDAHSRGAAVQQGIAAGLLGR